MCYIFPKRIGDYILSSENKKPTLRLDMASYPPSASGIINLQDIMKAEISWMNNFTNSRLAFHCIVLHSQRRIPSDQAIEGKST